jgi:putative glutamine transport system substrate-binding protein
MPSLKGYRKLLVFPLLLGLLSWAGCGEKKTVTVESVKARGKLLAGIKYDSQPFGYLTTQGELQGYDIELLREIAKRLLGDPQAITFQQVFSSTRLVALNSGSLDVVAATMTITPERAKLVDFSRPYFVAHQAVMVPVGSAVHKLDDLQGKTILFVLGTTGEATIKKRLPQARYVGFKTVPEALFALKTKQGDALTTDDSILYGLMAETCGFQLLPEHLSDEPYGLAFRKSGTAETANSLRNQVNTALLAMEKDGTLNRLKAKWIAPSQAGQTCVP